MSQKNLCWKDRSNIAKVIDVWTNKILLKFANHEKTLSVSSGAKFRVGQILRCFVKGQELVEWNELGFQETLPSSDHSLTWSKFVRVIREYFLEQEFVEAMTPSLTKVSGTEPYIEAFSVNYAGIQYNLPTSPEFALKKMLAQGHQRIFELRSCFRNDPVTLTHLPEFTMIEWYRSLEPIPTIIEDIKALTQNLSSAMDVRGPSEFKIVTMRDLIPELGLEPETSKESLVNFCKSNHVHYLQEDDWGELFWRIFLEKVERQLDPEIMHFVVEFPPQLRAYANLMESGWADRVEVYFQGLELANGYNEVTCPDLQLQLFRAENAKIDEDLIGALKAGMPPSSGVALGVDRLFMALLGEENISRLPRYVNQPFEKGE